MVVMPHYILAKQSPKNSRYPFLLYANLKILRPAVAEITPNLLINFVDWSDDVVRPTVLSERDLDARTRCLSGLDEYEPVLVGYNHAGFVVSCSSV